MEIIDNMVRVLRIRGDDAIAVSRLTWRVLADQNIPDSGGSGLLGSEGSFR